MQICKKYFKEKYEKMLSWKKEIYNIKIFH